MKRARFASGTILIVFFTLFACPLAFAATIPVTSLADSGPGSLRDAIATAAPGGTINFSVTGTITLNSTLSVGTSLTISGPGASSIAISGNNSVQVFSIGPSVTVVISGLTIEDGSAYDGGGVYNNGGTLTLSDCTLSGNSASDYGGGIWNETGTLTLTHSTLSGNSAFRGGGIWNANSSTLNVTNSTISGNSGNELGGGIWNTSLPGSFTSQTGSTLNVTNSIFSGNSAGSGGAVYNGASTMNVTNSTFSGNSASGSGGAGGIDNDIGTVTLTNSTLSGNSATRAGGILNTNGSTMTLTESTLSGNSGTELGGGIWNTNSSTMNVTNSTLSGNSAGSGGAVYNGASTMNVTNSTFSGNSGGGVVNDTGTLLIKNTVLANTPAGQNCFVTTGTTINSQGHNLSDDTSCTGFFNGTGDLNHTAAGLDPSGLKANGGPTQTIALLATSPAVDAIPLGYCTATDGTTPIATDQRAVARPQGDACDIGAYELNVVPYSATVQQPINADGSSVFNAKRGVVPVKFSLTYGGTATCNLPPATISLARTTGAVLGPIDESEYLQSSDIGSNFRIDSCQYIYNLATGMLGTGNYLVKIWINGSVAGSATFGLR